jgi:hypothetical protein
MALGHITKGELRVDNISFGFIEDIKEINQNKLKELIEG